MHFGAQKHDESAITHKILSFTRRLRFFRNDRAAHSVYLRLVRSCWFCCGLDRESLVEFDRTRDECRLLRTFIPGVLLPLTRVRDLLPRLIHSNISGVSQLYQPLVRPSPFCLSGNLGVNAPWLSTHPIIGAPSCSPRKSPASHTASTVPEEVLRSSATIMQLPAAAA